MDITRRVASKRKVKIIVWPIGWREAGKEDKKDRQASGEVCRSLWHPNSMDASRVWGPAGRGGADAPYKRFRLWRKPWRGQNSLPPSNEIPCSYQKERHDLRRVFLFGGPERDRTVDLSDANRTLSRTVRMTGPIWYVKLKIE